jgi:DNA polymerase I-like protein with 3'-5' exonuclease and polymerase domains
MARYRFDCETNGFLDTLTKVHSLVLQEVDTGVYYSCTENPYSSNDPMVVTDVTIEQAVRMLMEAEEIIGHNIIKFDIPAIQKVYPWFKPNGQITDTLVLARLIWGNIGDLYDSRLVKLGKFPGKLYGSHSLKAWGLRLGVLKGDFGETTDWQDWSWEMQVYCEQDVRVTNELHERILKKAPAEQAVWIEHEFCKIIAMQERHGFAFDEAGAVTLYSQLVKRRSELAEELQRAFPPVEKTEVFIPKVNNKARGYVKGKPFTKRWMVEFNPSSRQMIAERLIDLGWVPQEFTPSGQPKVDETVLEGLPYPEAKLLAEHFLVEKRIGQLAEGDQAWLKLVKNGRIHGSVNTNGAVTGRCTHSNPNVAQVPRVGSPYGAESRALFTTTPGFVLVGADLSGLELRCLAHFMARYDDGAYAKIVLEGDVHTVNQLAAGLPTRNDAKTFIYAFLYGAGDQKIGSIVAPNADAEEQKRIGRKLKKAFLKKTPALKKLREQVEAAAARGYLIGLDGRHLHIRSTHSALNTLLQSAGALISKVAMILAYRNLSARGYRFGKDYAFVAHIHDEIQTECRPAIAEEVGQIVVQAMRDAGEFFGFKCPIDGEFKIGSNWKETH